MTGALSSVDGGQTARIPSALAGSSAQPTGQA
jgi:hypothetical protein